MAFNFRWHGDAQLRKLQEATKDAIDETMIQCVATSVGRVHTISTVLQGSIDYRPAKIERDGMVVGEWGSYLVDYAIYEEILHPYLRPSADRHYPKLKERIARRVPR